MKEKLAKLVELKSIITLLFVGVVVFVIVLQTIRGKFELSPEVFVGMVMAALTYFFNRKPSTPSE